VSIFKLRAWKLALAGPSVFWFFPIFFVLLSTHPAVSALGLLGLLVVLIISASWGFLVNDLADRLADSKSGRADALHGHDLGKSTMVSLILLTGVLSWVVVFFIGGGYPFKVVLAFNYLVAVLYSVPPVKLKVRKFWGFLANSLIERPLPILVLLSYMGYYTALTVVLPVLVELTWSVFKHQAADVRGDALANVKTFAVYLGEAKSYRIVKYFLNPLSVVSLLSLIAIGWFGIPDLSLPLGVCFLFTMVGCTAAWLAERAGRLNLYLTPTDPPYVIFLNVSYRFVLLPVLAYGVLTLTPSYYALVLLLTLTLGYQAFAYAGLLRSLRSR
jgi:UbiA prenyltransferase family